MDSRAVFIFLYLMSAQAACGPVANRTNANAGALNATIRLIRREIRVALGHLATPGLLPDISCRSLNITELVGPEQQPFTAHNLSSFRCYMLKVSGRTPELSPRLRIISQYTQDVERAAGNQTARGDCSLPGMEQNDMDGYVFVKCLLELLDQRLSKATF